MYYLTNSCIGGTKRHNSKDCFQFWTLTKGARSTIGKKKEPDLKIKILRLAINFSVDFNFQNDISGTIGGNRPDEESPLY